MTEEIKSASEIEKMISDAEMAIITAIENKNAVLKRAMKLCSHQKVGRSMVPQECGYWCPTCYGRFDSDPRLEIKSEK